jgi:hypothetical protein
MSRTDDRTSCTGDQRCCMASTYTEHKNRKITGTYHASSGIRIHDPSVRGEGVISYLRLHYGRAIAQAVSRRLPTTSARVRAQVKLCGICSGQSGTGAGFLRVLRFPLPNFIPPTAPHSSSIIRGWYDRPVSGRRTKWTQSRPTQRN